MLQPQAPTCLWPWAEDIVQCVLPAVWLQAGVNRQCLLTTNFSESLNKEEVDCKENKIPCLISHQ